MKFRGQATCDIFNGDDTEAARRALPQELHARAGRLLDRINAAAHPADLRTPRGNRLHQLVGDRAGQWSVSINDTYRICFAWENDEATDVEITDYH